jgi:putative ABC transport system permease protein
MFALLRTLTWPELRRHPLRQAMALVAVALGVALAWSVHLIHASALAEFGAAVRAVDGQPDFELRAQRGGFDEALYARVATHRLVAQASPVIEIDTYALDAGGRRVPLRVLGIDAFAAAALTPALLPRGAPGATRSAALDPQAAFVNEAARRAFGDAGTLRVQSGLVTVGFSLRGSVAADGPALAVIDIAGVQQHFGWLGRIGRIDVRLTPGADRATALREFELPPGVRAAAPDEAALRVSNLSRAYRVNLGVLALVALFTGAFLVYSVLALSVAQRQPQFALLGVLGLAARERLALVLAEAALVGTAGSALGIAAGTLVAQQALQRLGGDLGGGYFRSLAPTLQFDAGAALAYAAVGIAAALAAGWIPARAAARIAPAQALKGLGAAHATLHRAWGPVLLGAGALLAFAPSIAGIPLAAYASVACLLVGGIACVPWAVQALLGAVAPPRGALALLAVERARDRRDTATVAMAGVVTSLALAVALTVMVASFREAVTRWLDAVLPADLYLRTAANSAAGDAAFLPPALVDAIGRIDGVARAEAQRAVPLQLDATRPDVVLLARATGAAGERLPLVGDVAPAEPGRVSIWASEATARLYGARPGSDLALPLPDGTRIDARVRGVWRDYARQHGSIAIALADFRRLSGDRRVNDVALWLAPGADAAKVQAAIRAAAGAPALLDFATPGELRAVSLRIFDRSFAVTYALQAVAIGIGLVGVAASFSTQVLARRREFALLAHLGLTRRELLAVVAAEGAVWSAAGALLGVALGIAVAVVLVHVVNPQSFHWTMELLLPWARLGVLAGAVVAAGTATAALATQHAAPRDLALAAKEDD